MTDDQYQGIERHPEAAVDTPWTEVGDCGPDDRCTKSVTSYFLFQIDVCNFITPKPQSSKRT
ncbi:MAG TPA: hypothetical protein VK014_12685 [Cyclobacteriaceae bacterium]|nr:hypothetical protein [Cyclobacteriaceae bacterium]